MTLLSSLACTLQGNTGKTFGGGVFRSTSKGDVMTNYFISNSAKTLGGAVYDAEVWPCFTRV